MIRLGHMHLRGLGFRPSCTTAVQYLKPAAERALFGAAMEEANRNYWDGDDGRTEEALHIYLHIAEAGVDTAQANAALLLAEEVERNPHLPQRRTGADPQQRSFAADAAAAPDDAQAASSAPPPSDDAEWAALLQQATGWPWQATALAWLPAWLHWPSTVETQRCQPMETGLLHSAASQGHIASVLALGDCYFAEYVEHRRRVVDIVATHSGDALDGDPSALLRAKAEATRALRMAKESASRAAAQYFQTTWYGAGTEESQAETHGQALYSLAFLRFFGVALTADIKLIERYGDAVVATNPQVRAQPERFCIDRSDCVCMRRAQLHQHFISFLCAHPTNRRTDTGCMVGRPGRVRGKIVLLCCVACFGRVGFHRRGRSNGAACGGCQHPLRHRPRQYVCPAVCCCSLDGHRSIRHRSGNAADCTGRRPLSEFQLVSISFCVCPTTFISCLMISSFF
jgi:hypothetical protein